MAIYALALQWITLKKLQTALVIYGDRKEN